MSLASPPSLLEPWCRLEELFWAEEIPGVEPPTVAEVHYELQPGLAERPVAFAVVDDGEVAASYAGGEPLLENLDLAFGWITVGKRWRRQGVAGLLLEAARAAHRVSGRGLLESSVRVGSAGSAFAAQAGARVTQIELCNVLDLTRLPADLDALAATVPPGYVLRTWQGACPDDLVDAYAAAHAAMNDAPRGQERQDPRWTAQRVRDAEDRQRRSGVVALTTAALHEATGAVGGYTDVLITGRPTTVVQEDTGVVRDHRGHGLGLLQKAANLMRVRELMPELATVVTWNAENNQHMLAVNDRLGFRPHSRWEEVALDL